MDKEQFIILLKKYGVEDIMKEYREQLNQKEDINDSDFLKNFKQYYHSSIEEKKGETLNYIEDILSNGLLILLGLLDGSSNINQDGTFKLYYETEGEKPYLVNNREEDDLLTLWYDDDDEN